MKRTVLLFATIALGTLALAGPASAWDDGFDDGPPPPPHDHHHWGWGFPPPPPPFGWHRQRPRWDIDDRDAPPPPMWRREPPRFIEGGYGSPE